jgi:hypothetical protein
MNSEQMNTEQRRQFYLTKMRLIESHMQTLLGNFDAITREDYQMISQEITRLLQVAETCVNYDPMLNNVVLTRGNGGSNNYNLWDVANFPQTDQPMTISEFGVEEDDLLVEDDPPISLSEFDATSLVEEDDLASLLVEDDSPMTVSEFNATSLVEADVIVDDGEYQEYISNKIRPRLTAKSYSKKETTETVTMCSICMERNGLPDMVTLNCGHEFCIQCVCLHFHHSVENQPYQKFYGCLMCRSKVTRVRVNYSRTTAKTVYELMNGLYIPDFLKILCEYK